MGRQTQAEVDGIDHKEGSRVLPGRYVIRTEDGDDIDVYDAKGNDGKVEREIYEQIDAMDEDDIEAVTIKTTGDRSDVVEINPE